MSTDWSKLKRSRYPMPSFIRQALVDAAVLSSYRARPAYQQNDYIGWIVRAKQEETKLKRLHQMISELRVGDTYMKMPYKAKG